MSAPERTMVVWCPDWPVVAAGTPPDASAAVFSANRVVASSPAARADGVHRGLRRREAQARCPELVVLEHDPARDARAFEPVVAAVESFAPRVEIDRPGRCAVATRGPSRYFGGDDALASRVAAAVGHGCRVGIADGRFAAGLAAHVDGVVSPGGSAEFLAPFPVSALDRPDLVDLLRRLGIRTLGGLAALPAADVLARFGTDGAIAHRLARGLDERPLAARIPPPDLTVAMELDPPALRVDTAAFAAKSLADALHAQLADLGLACTRIAIEAETEHGEAHSRLWRHDGALTAGAIAERVRWQLDGWLHAADAGATGDPGGDGAPTAGITLIRLVPDEVRPDTGRQLGFWGGAAEGDERAARALARVQGMLGPDEVCTAVLGGGRSPVEQVRLVPWGDAREPARPGAANPAGWREVPPWPGQVPSPAPATVHLAAVPAQVVTGEGGPVQVSGRGVLDGAPQRLSIDGGPWHDVVAWAGPWLVDERWWDLDAHRRRARFQLLTGDGTAVLTALEGGRWWVEATYD